MHCTTEACLRRAYIGSFKYQITVPGTLCGFKAFIYNSAEFRPVLISACKWTKERAVVGSIKGDGIVHSLFLNV